MNIIIFGYFGNKFVLLICKSKQPIALDIFNQIDYYCVMEKRSAHYSLDSIKQMIVHQELRRITSKAFQDAYSLGLNEEDIVETVLKLKPVNLHKSMTVDGNHTIWQDVYYIKNFEIDLYVKLQINEKSVVISFKERENE